MKARVVAVLAVAAISLCMAVEVPAQIGIELCTGQLASAPIEQPYLSRLENGLERLSSGSTGAVPELEQLFGQASTILVMLREEALVDALAFAQAVERALKVGGSEAVLTEPALATAWARFRLTFADSLQTGDCPGEAEELLAKVRLWPIADTGIAAGVIASHGALLVRLGRLHGAIETLRPFLEAEVPPLDFTELRTRFAALNNLGAALRQSGERTRVARVYQKALTLVLDPASVALIRTDRDRLTYESGLAKLYLNFAALMLFNQDTDKTWPYLQKAHIALERSGQTES